MFAIICVNFEAFQCLPPFQFKLMAAVLRYVNRQGECCPTLAQLAADVLVSEATVSRAMTRLAERGCFTRERQGNGRYRYRVAGEFLARRRKPELPPARRNSPRGMSTLQDGLSHGARQEVEPSSGLRPSEGGQAALSEGEIPDGWKDAAASERRLAGLGEINLQAEWRKLIAYSEGQRITIWRWRGWVLKARGDRPRETATVATASPIGDALPGDHRQQRQARDWVTSGFWLRDGSWGPPPDQPGCTLPPDLIAWCLAERAARAA